MKMTIVKVNEFRETIIRGKLMIVKLYSTLYENGRCATMLYGLWQSYLDS
jgi:hypothetical protein